MSETAEIVLRTALTGAGATLVMDGWALVLRQFGIPSLNFALLGRWIGHLPRGKWTHASIAKTTPVRGEALTGWCAHYSIGIASAALLPALFGERWARSPNSAARALHRARIGRGTSLHLAASVGSRDRILEDSKTGLQQPQERGHAHCLWLWDICLYLGAEMRKLSLIPASKNTGQTRGDATADGAANGDLETSVIPFPSKSGGRDSNPRPRAWEARPGLTNVPTGSWHHPFAIRRNLKTRLPDGPRGTFGSTFDTRTWAVSRRGISVGGQPR